MTINNNNNNDDDDDDDDNDNNNNILGISFLTLNAYSKIRSTFLTLLTVF